MSALFHRCALLLCGVLGAGEYVARAELEPEPQAQRSGRLGVVVVARDNLGALGDRYRFGFLYGLYAGLDMPVVNSDWSLGLGWNMLVRGHYFASESKLVDQSIEVTEADLGVRIRRRLSEDRQYVLMTAGGVFTTNNVPIPPAEKRRYLGYFVGLGYEFPLIGHWGLGVESRYSRYPSGPENISFYLNLAAGIRN